MTFSDPNASFSGRPEDQPHKPSPLEALAALQRSKKPADKGPVETLAPGTPVRTGEGGYGVVLEAGPELPANTPGLPENYHPGYVVGFFSVDAERRYHPEELTKIEAPPAKNTKG